MKKKFKLIIGLEVDESWVADGFDLNHENVNDRLHALLPYAYASEFKAKVLDAPSRASIREAQGSDR